jgi:hypothetical protein
MITYKIGIKDPITGTPSCVNRSDGWSIPLDPANTDYQAYLAWLAEGNEVLPPDEPQQEQ